MNAWLKNAAWFAALALGAWGIEAAAGAGLNRYWINVLGDLGIAAIMAVSLNLVNGITGQFSIGHAGFMAVGAYIGATLTKLYGIDIWHMEPKSGGILGLFVLALLLGGIGAAVAGLLVGIPSLRLKGDYLAIVTLGFGQIIGIVIVNIQFVGGAVGIFDIPRVAGIGWIMFILGLTVLVSYRLLASREGRALLSVREDEIAAESLGVNTTTYKVKAFVIGAFFAGMAGVLFGHFKQNISTPSFDFSASFIFVTMVVLGGMGSISGSLLAAVILSFLQEFLRKLKDWETFRHFFRDTLHRDIPDLRMVIFALLLIIMMLLRPQGLLGRREIWEFIPGWKKKTGGNKTEAGS